METKTILTAALISVLALTTARAADMTPAETKTIAEEGFIYGLPIVMNYAVMYAYAVDKGNPEFKAPFNQIKNEARVFTYKDTAIVTPNSDTPYSFAWLDLRAEPIVLSVPAAAAPPATMPPTTWLPDRTGKVRPRRVSRKCSIPPRSSRWPAIARNSLARTTCLTWSRFSPATKCSRSPPS